MKTLKLLLLTCLAYASVVVVCASISSFGIDTQLLAPPSSNISQFAFPTIEQPDQSAHIESDGTRELSERLSSLISNSAVPPTGDAFYKHSKFMNRQLYIIAVEDHHSERAMRVFEKTIVPKLQSLPDKNILFLIEQGELSTPEDELLIEFANRFKIPLENPLVHPFNAAVAEFAGVDPLVAATHLALVQTMSMSRRMGSNLQTEFSTWAQSMAVRFGVSDELIKASMVLDSVTYGDAAFEIAVQTWRAIARAANVLMQAKVIRILEKYPQVTHVVCLVGKGHLPVFEDETLSQNFRTHQIYRLIDLLEEYQYTLQISASL